MHPRLAALDLFRGLTIAGMILVSNPGGPESYATLEHAPWNGWTPTDLVFPTFAFILGVSLVYALASRRGNPDWAGLTLFDWFVPALGLVQYTVKFGVQTGGFAHAPTPGLGGYDLFFGILLLLLVALPRLERRATSDAGRVDLHVLHHGVLIFALGFFWTFDAMNPAGFRAFGVLQRLGIVYVLAGLIVAQARWRGQIAAVAALLATYWIVMKTIPVPGYGAGVLTMEGNLAGFVDRMIIGRAHMYTPSPLPFWDPEGLLGAIPATATALIGALAAGWIRATRPPAAKLAGLLVAGGVLVVAGLVLAPWFPINKNLWSPTFALFDGGIDLLLLGVCIWLMAFDRVTKLSVPMIALGANSILVYVLSGTLMHYAANIPAGSLAGASISLKEVAYQYAFASWLTPRNASLAMALAYVALWAAIAVWLYRRRLFVRV